jgi:hypothetical protein
VQGIGCEQAIEAVESQARGKKAPCADPDDDAGSERRPCRKRPFPFRKVRPDQRQEEKEQGNGNQPVMPSGERCPYDIEEDPGVLTEQAVRGRRGPDAPPQPHRPFAANPNKPHSLFASRRSTNQAPTRSYIARLRSANVGARRVTRSVAR